MKTWIPIVAACLSLNLVPYASAQEPTEVVQTEAIPKTLTGAIELHLRNLAMRPGNCSIGFSDGVNYHTTEKFDRWMNMYSIDAAAKYDAYQARLNHSQPRKFER